MYLLRHDSQILIQKNLNQAKHFMMGTTKIMILPEIIKQKTSGRKIINWSEVMKQRCHAHPFKSATEIMI